MNVAERGIRMASATLPRTQRDRYREQWLADLRDAHELGISRAAIVAGALVFSLKLGRTAEVRGYTVSELMLRRLRWGLALVSSAVVLLFTLWFSGIASATNVVDTLAIAMALRVLGTTPLIMLCAGLWQLIAAARAANGQALAGTIFASVAFLSLVAPITPGVNVPGWYWAGGFTVAAIFLMLVVGAVLALVGFARGLAGADLPVHEGRRTTTSARRARAGALAFVALIVLLVVGTYETLVLGPLAQAPDYSLSQIYAMLSPADRSWGIMTALIWPAFWGLVALASLVLCLVRGRVDAAFNILFTPRRVLVYTLALVSVMLFFHWWSAFSLGMSIADTVPLMSGNPSWQAMALGLLGSSAMVAAIMLALVPGRPHSSAPVSSAAPTLTTA